MASSTVSPENALVIALGKLHSDYTIALLRPPSEIYPYIHVTNGKKYVNIQVRLAEIHWSIPVLDRVVTKAIKQIEANGEPKE